MYFRTGVSLTSGNSANCEVVAGQPDEEDDRDEQHARSEPAAGAGSGGAASGPCRRPRSPTAAAARARRRRWSRPGPLTDADVGPAGGALAGGGGGAVEHDRHRARSPGRRPTAAPTLRICSAETTGLPRPGPLTRAAMVAIDSAAIVHWLTPTTIVRRAIGSCTWRSIWRPGQPHRPGRLDRGRRDGLDAVLGDPDQRRQRVDEGEHDRRGRHRSRRTAPSARGSRTPGWSASGRGPA